MDWRDETEFRWVFSAEEGQGNIFIPVKEALKCVIVGLDFPRVYYPSLRHMCESNDVKIMKMRWYRGHFEGPTDISED